MGQKRNEDELINIGNRLQAARLALGLSQKDIYEAIDVKATTWNHWESGKRIPDPLAMKDLYLLHGVTMEWIYAGDPKGLPFNVAQIVLKTILSETAIQVIKKQFGNHMTNVFTYRGNPIRRANTKSFKKACKIAGIESFRWHDLRHTWATCHIQRGTPLEALQKLGGWSDYKMVQRYAHFSSQHLLQYVNKSPMVSATNSATVLNFGQ